MWVQWHGYRQCWMCEQIIVIAEWLNASQRSQVGIGLNRSARGRSVKCFEKSQGQDTYHNKNIPL